jgi:TctA family transporter
MDALATAFGLVFQPYVLTVIALSALYGLFVGAIPGLTATMATALLVPVTFFMPPVPAVAAIVTATAMAIFSGDIPSALLRMPGTPASAAYTDEAYLLTKRGQAELALGSGLVFSVLGGIFGVVVLIVAAPVLAEVALKFSSFEYFWLVMLGFTCAIFIAGDDLLKGTVSLLLGLTQALGVNLVNANLSAIQGSLGATAVEASWLVTAYTATNVSAALLLTKARFQFGLRLFADVGIVTFLVISVVHPLCSCARRSAWRRRR